MPKRAADDSDAIKRPRQKKVKRIEGISDEDFKNTDALLVQKLLIKGHVKNLIQLVQADWHDGYDFQEDEIGRYKTSLEPILQAVYNISVIGEKEFVRCHDIIKVIADSWVNLIAVPKRGGVEEYFTTYNDIRISVKVPGNGATVFTTRDGNEILREMWTRFLLAAASNTTMEKVSDEQLLQFIKDASDYEVNVLEPIVNVDAADECFQRNTEDTLRYSDGVTRLAALFNDKLKWGHLPTCRKPIKRIKVIDRRFAGPKHLRTRNYDDDDDDEDADFF